MSEDAIYIRLKQINSKYYGAKINVDDVELLQTKKKIQKFLDNNR